MTLIEINATAFARFGYGIKSEATKEKYVRRLESEIIAEFNLLKPQLLGYIYDILVKTIHLFETITLKELPRMADFALWGEAIARSMGYEPLEFMKAYYNNIGKQNMETIESHPIALAITKLVDYDNKSWISTPKKLLDSLNEVAEIHSIDTLKLWPKSVNSLARRINVIKSNLLEGLDIDIKIERLTKGTRPNTSIIKIHKITPIYPISPAEQIPISNMDKFMGNHEFAGDIVSPFAKISPANNDKSDEEKLNPGGPGHTGDINNTNQKTEFKREQGNTSLNESHRSDDMSNNSVLDYPNWCYYCNDTLKT